MRVLGIRVDEEGVTIEWGLMGNELIRVKVTDGATLVKVNEMVRKDLIDEVIEKSAACVHNLGECVREVPRRKDRERLRDLITHQIMISEESCVEHGDIIEYAEAVGYSREDAEEVIKEMLEDGEIEGEGCYELVDDALDP